MKKCKEHKLTTTKITNEKGQDKKIFINDELTAYYRNLLWKTKTKAKECNWKYVRVKDGGILAKKNDTSRPIYIRKISDINFNE